MGRCFDYSHAGWHKPSEFLRTKRSARVFSVGLRLSSFLSPRSSILGPQSSVLSPQFSVLNPWSSVLNPRSSVLSPQSSVLSPQSSVLSPITYFYIFQVFQVRLVFQIF